MILKDIINKSYYGSVGYISNLDDISRLEQYIIYNLSVLKEFINIITSTTYVDNNPELEKYGLRKNMSYGTKLHLDAIKSYGISHFLFNNLV